MAGAVLLFDAVTLVVFPAVGGLLDLPDRVFGVWAGLAMFSTGPVAAAGFAYSPVAGNWAMVTKLVRNASIGVVAVWYAVVYRDPERGESGSPLTWGAPAALVRQFPRFLVGFVLVVAIANAGVLDPAQLAAIDTVSGWLFALAFAGVGFSIQVDEMRSAGVGPMAVIAVYTLVVSAVTLAVVVTLL